MLGEEVKQYSLTLWFLVAATMSLFADPIVMPPVPFVPAPALSVQALIVLISLVAESLVIALLCGRRRWIRDSLLWFVVTLGTFGLLVLAPMRYLGWKPTRFADMYGGTIIWLEVTIVLLESLILWLLWFRRSGRSLISAVLLAGVGNCVSYGMSLICFYCASGPRSI